MSEKIYILVRLFGHYLAYCPGRDIDIIKIFSAIWNKKSDNTDKIIRMLNNFFLPNQEYTQDLIIDLYSIPRWIDEDVFRECKDDLYDIVRRFTPGKPYYLYHTKGEEYSQDPDSWKILYNLELNEMNFYLGIAWYFYVVEYFYPYSVPFNTSRIVQKIIKNYDKIMNESDHFLFWRETQHLMKDGHCLTSWAGEIYMGDYILPINLMFVDGVVIVRDVKKRYSNEIKIGSEILEINDINVDVLMKSQRIYSRGSNDNYEIYSTLDIIVKSQKTKTAKIKFKGGVSVVVENFERKAYHEKGHPQRKYALEKYNIKIQGRKTGFIEDDIFYVNGDMLGKYNAKDIGGIIRSGDIKSLILDHRGYDISRPEFQNFILSSLFSKLDDFALVESNMIMVPCMKKIYFSKPWQFDESLFPKKDLKIKIIILVDHASISRSEWATMQYQRIQIDSSRPKNVITVGQQTAGADGNVRNFYLPGKIVVMMTFLGVFYPNSIPTQRKGIIIDKYVDYKADEDDQIFLAGVDMATAI
ncbi:MAG: hypothetical protein Hyperionvirus16_6 [Hyperionvirus sp.]|uniref:Tail specific protease domain-containing protein n=1 Tax=Hyperionvirus sp. TaxID=2487770 RepID=A0A3G5ACP6_9VIRU|nr:MAG: hypothetical protein Hyperionvirus16_6 [Hyperionvirus sp.]